MYKLGLSLLFIAMAFSSAEAQVKKKIKKGRRNKAESQFMLDSNYLELDWETGYETINNDVSTVVYPNLLVRYGISKYLEVNAEINYITATDKSATVKNVSGVEPMQFGASYLLQGETKHKPAIIASAQLAIPFMASRNFTALYAAPTLLLTVQKPAKRWLIGASAGAFWDGFNPSASFVYNTSVAYNFSSKWMLTSEFFGFINGSAPQHNTDISFTYSLNKRVQFGCTAGTGLSAAAHKSYFAVNGVWGWSLKKRNKQPVNSL